MDATVRILQVIKGLDIGGQNGGSETFGANLSRQLQRDGCEVTLCAFYRYGTPVERNWCEQLEGQGIKVIFASPDAHTHLLHAVRLLKVVCRERNIDLIHSHQQLGTLAAVMVKMTGAVKAVVRTAHITQEWGTGPLAWVMRQVFTHWLFPIFADAEVGVSAAIAAQLKRHPGARLMRRQPLTIYNAIDDRWIGQQPAVRENRRQNDPFVIGSVGRLTARKGYGFLLRAFAILSRTDLTAALVLVGDGEDRAKLEAQASALSIQNRVSFLGQRTDVQDLLKGFDLFVLPSFQEGLPTVLLESMACGVPVIATDIPGTRELVEDGVNGWLVPPGDAEALARKIQQAIRSPEELERLRMAAVKTVQKFSFHAAANQYETLYQHLLVTQRVKT